jgi:hypothetical protein
MNAGTLPMTAPTDKLFDALDLPRIDCPEPIEEMPRQLNPYAWPACLHCGGNVHCEDYEPDTDGPLWTPRS